MEEYPNPVCSQMMVNEGDESHVTKKNTVDDSEILHQLRLAAYPTPSRVFFTSQVVIAGFVPSTVSPKEQIKD